MGLAGESLVQRGGCRRLARRWSRSRSTTTCSRELDGGYRRPRPHTSDRILLADARREVGACLTELGNKSSSFDDHASRAEDLNDRLYREVILSRMRPFADGVHGFPRLVRDMARSLGKEVRLVVAGEQAEVDRDILEKLESPLSHLIRNAVDHGLELPEARRAARKPAFGIIRLEARHAAGMLPGTIADDGAGSISTNCDRRSWTRAELAGDGRADE